VDRRQRDHRGAAVERRQVAVGDRAEEANVPPAREALEQRRPHRLLLLALAGWFTYLRSCDDVEDPHADRLQRLARAGGTDPRPLLDERWLFGDLGNRAVAAELAAVLQELERDGVRATLTRALESPADREETVR
jgi:fructuronate reductase/mannitol 2-dehydrogenase